MRVRVGRDTTPYAITKSPTGVRGLDEITAGGLPAGRTTLICGGPGCGKTLLAAEIVARGATKLDERGVFLSFEQSTNELYADTASLQLDLPRLVDEGRIHLECIPLAPSEVHTAGAFNLDPIIMRIEAAVKQTGARRVAIDTLESLFSTLGDSLNLRSEVFRLVQWLRQQELTTVMTCERGAGALSRHGVEEYVTDCVILLDHRVDSEISKRRLRIVKYRGTAHGLDEYPFLIGERGLSVLPISSSTLDHPAPTETVSTGVDDLDQMFHQGGYYRGSSVLVSGTPGTGKTTLAAHFAGAACARGERCLYLAFEESVAQLVRNMRSVGLDLQPHLDSGNLLAHAVRPTSTGLEEHLVIIYDLVHELRPTAVVMDPISNFTTVGTPQEVRSMLIRLLGHLKTHQITGVFTSLAISGLSPEETETGISSLMDTWLILRPAAALPNSARALRVLKSRGMGHDTASRELLLGGTGIFVGEPLEPSSGAFAQERR